MPLIVFQQASDDLSIRIQTLRIKLLEAVICFKHAMQHLTAVRSSFLAKPNALRSIPLILEPCRHSAAVNWPRTLLDPAAETHPSWEPRTPWTTIGRSPAARCRRRTGQGICTAPQPNQTATTICSACRRVWTCRWRQTTPPPPQT